MDSYLVTGYCRIKVSLELEAMSSDHALELAKQYGLGDDDVMEDEHEPVEWEECQDV